MAASDLRPVPEILFTIFGQPDAYFLSKGRDLVRQLELGEAIEEEARQRVIAGRFVDIMNYKGPMTAREQQMVVTLVKFLNPETARNLPVAQQTTANNNNTNNNDDDRDEVDSAIGDMR